MSRAHLAVRGARALAVLTLVAALAACADAPTAATAPRRSASPAARDGDPPDSPCFSGWVVVNGVWSCFDS